MKTYFFTFFILTCFCIFDTKAQYYSTEFQNMLTPYPGGIPVEVYSQQVMNNYKATGNQSRLVSVVYGQYNNGSFPMATGDSTIFIYQGNNGWDSILQEWAFDTARGPIGTLAKTYSTNGRTGIQYVTPLSSSYYGRGIYIYDNNGWLAQIQGETLDNGNWLPGGSTRYEYNMQGQQTLKVTPGDSIITNYGPEGVYSKTYYSKSTGQWQLSLMQYWAYYQGKLIAVSTKISTNSGMAEIARNTYSYDNNGRVASCKQMTQTINGNQKDTTVYNFTYNTAGYLAARRTEKGSTGTDTSAVEREISYNYLNQVISEKIKVINLQTNASRYVSEWRYHFVPLFPQSVANKPNRASLQLDIYPVPAKHHITATVNGTQGSHNWNICRMDGAVVQQLATHDSRSDIDIQAWRLEITCCV